MEKYDQDKALIYIVDDDQVSCALSEHTLEERGFNVQSFNCARSALERLHYEKPDLLLVDVIMPGMTGLDMCKQIRALPEFSHIPIVMMTGLKDHNSMLSAYNCGATDFITKPVDWTILTYRLHYMLAASNALDSLRNNNQKLIESEKRLEASEKIAKLGSWEFDSKSNYLHCSEEFFRILELPPTRFFTKKQYLSQIPDKERRRILLCLKKSIKQLKCIKIEHRIISKKTKKEKVIELIIDSKPIHKNTDAHTFGSIQDISERKHAENKIYQLSNYDTLTKLPNRTNFQKITCLALNQAIKEKTQLALLIIDIDDFKKINDHLGHSLGDELLVMISKRIKNICRIGDNLMNSGDMKITTSRFGGDEFILLLENINRKSEANAIADRIMQEISKPTHLNGHEITVSSSTGISFYPDDGNDFDMLLKNADLAMYYAKDESKNSFSFYSHHMSEKIKNEIVLENYLREAIPNNQLYYEFQEQLNLDSLDVSGAELLMRWEHPELGKIMPFKFIGIAENAGLMNEITQWLISDLLSKFGEEIRSRPELIVAINISPSYFLDPSFIEFIIGSLSQYKVPGKSIELEITEDVLMNDIDKAIKHIEVLRNMDINIAIDDFGTGYSSFNYLQKLPINTVKIDKSFIDEIFTRSNGHAITKSIIEMCHALNMKVVAEGVETVEQLKFLESIECDFAQGYFISKPHLINSLSELNNFNVDK